MNVIIANLRYNDLNNLDIDIIKSISGVYDVSKLISMFSNFFYSKMIIDVTALKGYNNIQTYELLIKNLDANKIIFLLPQKSKLSSSKFLSELISLGIYNFTNSLEGVKHLIHKSNTLDDVSKLINNSNVREDNNKSNNSLNINTTSNSSDLENHLSNSFAKTRSSKPIVIGFKNVVEHAGSTTFVYLLRNELANYYGNDNVIAIEVNKDDFQVFRSSYMVNCKASDIKNVLSNYSNVRIILIDLNDFNDDGFCNDVIYLIEPSIIKLNKLVLRNKLAFSKLQSKKVVLNQSLLLNKDVFDFEKEVGLSVFYNMPPLDDRKRNAILSDFLSKLGLINQGSSSSSGKIFGLFRR